MNQLDRLIKNENNSGFARILMKKYMCILCGLIYDEAVGWEEDGIAAGTKWADVPENWFCPDCGAMKSEFEMVEV